MAIGKWIGAFLGALNGGVLGGLAGYAIGALFDDMIEGAGRAKSSGAYSEKERYDTSSSNTHEGERNGFLFSLLVLSAHVIQADGKIMHSEMNFVRSFLRHNFGEGAVSQGEEILLRLFDYRKAHGEREWDAQMLQACGEIARVMPEEHRLQLIAFLCEIAKADGVVAEKEIEVIRNICISMHLNASAVDQFLALRGPSIEDAYKVLGISPSATDEEVRKAYRELVRKNHPDRVTTLGEDIREAAKVRMQEINDAKERIYNARGL